MQNALDQNVREDMNIVIVGHVDHGKSTIIGRLLADTGSLPEGKLEFIRENCLRNSKPFEYAFLLDALKDEQAQGITIDAARCFFKTEKRNYIILDAPGHIEFLKNMVTGASRAEAALLAIDAAEGIQENSKRHGYLLSLLGIRQVAVLVNKMDLVGYSEQVFSDIRAEYTEFLSKIGIESAAFLPVSGFMGDNIARNDQKNMPWYAGSSVLEMLDAFQSAALPFEMPLRMPVQQVYKFTQNGDMRRIVAGTIDTGTLRAGDRVVFYPSGKSSRVATIEEFNAPLPEEAGPGKATGFTLRDQIYVVRGELAAKAAEPPPKVAERITANLFWLARQPMVMGKSYYIKLGTAKIAFELEQVLRVLDTSDLSSGQKNKIECNDAAECILSLKKPLAFDLAADNPTTSRFVIVDDFEISGGGIITEALTDDTAWVRDKVITRNQRWVMSEISRLDRAERYHQKASLVIITGLKNSGKKTLARALEKRLFDDGQITYFIGMGNLLYGVDADIKKPGMNGHKPEHIRRLAEVCNLMLDAGVIVIVTAIELEEADIGIMRTIVSEDDIHIIWKGESNTTGVACDLQFDAFGNTSEQTDAARALLRQKGALFNPRTCRRNL